MAKKRGPKTWDPSAKELDTVQKLASYGLTHEQIASVLGKSISSLERHCSDALSIGESKGLADLKISAHKQALAGDTTLLIFLLKTRAGLKETKSVELSGAEGKPPLQAPVVEVVLSSDTST